MKNEIDKIRVKLENVKARAVKERDKLTARIAELDKEIETISRVMVTLEVKDHAN